MRLNPIPLTGSSRPEYLGLSKCTSTDIRHAHAIRNIAAIQVEYSPFALDIEDEKIAVLKTAREHGITRVGVLLQHERYYIYRCAPARRLQLISRKEIAEKICPSMSCRYAFLLRASH